MKNKLKAATEKLASTYRAFIEAKTAYNLLVAELRDGPTDSVTFHWKKIAVPRSAKK